MGGSSATQQTDTTSGITGFPGQPANYTMQPGLPWNNDQIANVLAAGYGGNRQTYMDALAQIYKPMNFKSYQPVGQAVAAPKATTGGLGASAYKAPPGFNGPVEQMLSRQISAGGTY